MSATKNTTTTNAFDLNSAAMVARKRYSVFYGIDVYTVHDANAKPAKQFLGRFETRREAALFRADLIAAAARI